MEEWMYRSTVVLLLMEVQCMFPDLTIFTIMHSVFNQVCYVR
jgi:hypothetical protein